MEEVTPEDNLKEAQFNIDDIELPVIELPDDILRDIRANESTAEAEISETDTVVPVQEEQAIPEIIMPEISLAGLAPEYTEETFSEPIPESVPEITQEVVQEIQPEPAPVPVAATQVLPIITEPAIEPEELAELVDEKVLTDVIKNEVSTLSLDDEDLDTFSYFLPITGMRNSIVQVLSGAAERISKPELHGGNIIIVGEPGSGKTQMATSIIKVLEKKTGYPKGGIGKISGEKLNEKDIQKLYSKIMGGCLIIETAGEISKETAVTLSLLMEQDNTGTILIIEDNKRGIEKALAKDGSFAKRFTEKIVIPAFTIDELVSFGRTYANEAGCTIDDMGVLALYNRINNIGRYNHATTIKEVAEIMDDAIEKSTRGGFFNKPKYDRDGNVILKEKDFD